MASTPLSKIADFLALASVYYQTVGKESLRGRLPIVKLHIPSRFNGDSNGPASATL